MQNNQISIPFEEIIQVFDGMKRKRRSGLKATGIFTDPELDFLVKITYDLTDKDFEYLIAILLEEDGFETSVNGGRDDKGVDILAKKGDVTLAIQCKQWAKSRITIQDAGKFFVSVFHELQKKSDRKIAYVTTSWVPPETEEFFKNQGIIGAISNKKIVQECKRLGYFSEEGWQKLISKIRDKRVADLFHRSQLSLPVSQKNILTELRQLRLKEMKNHLPISLRYKKSLVEANNENHQNFYKNFFKYWGI